MDFNKKKIIGGIVVFCTILMSFVFVKNPLNLYVIIDGGGGGGSTTTYQSAPYDESYFDFQAKYFGTTTQSTFLTVGYMNKNTGKGCIQGEMLPCPGSYNCAGFTTLGYIGDNIALTPGKTYTLSTKVFLKSLIEAWAVKMGATPFQDSGNNFDLEFRLYFQLLYRITGDSNPHYVRLVIIYTYWDDATIYCVDPEKLEGDTADANTLKYQIDQYLTPTITYTPQSSHYGWQLQVSLYIDTLIIPDQFFDPAKWVDDVESRFLIPGTTTGPLSDSYFRIEYFKIVG